MRRAAIVLSLAALPAAALAAVVFPPTIPLAGGAPIQATPVYAVDPNGNYAGGDPASSAITPLGYQQITNTMLVNPMHLTVPTGARRAVIQSNGNQSIRWRGDGPDPTKQIGMRLNGGESMDYVGTLSTLSFIREDDGSELDITYYG